jgi:hypothetical protein
LLLRSRTWTVPEARAEPVAGFKLPSAIVPLRFESDVLVADTAEGVVPVAVIVPVVWARHVWLNTKIPSAASMTTFRFIAFSP